MVAGRPSRSIPPAPRRSQDLPLRGRRHRGSSPSVLGSCHYDRRGQGNSSLRGANFASSTRELTLAQVGFVHCAFEEQVAGVANSFFRGVAKLVVLRISIDKLNAEVRYEDLEGGNVLFPHVYGPLNLDAVVAVMALPRGRDGTFTFTVAATS
ncbi:MAG: DUF952 domain-containing protein [Chloroflexi bacterium]|nr:MAG: DUF952 domain-containing protein [Chloroflexota bacterium]